MLKDIAIGIKTFLRDEKLFHTLASIRRRLPECQLIVADDGDMTEEKDGIYADLERDGHIVIRMPFDSGFGAKSNAIVSHSARPYLLVGSDDFDFFPADVRVGVEKMLAVLKLRSELMVVSGRVDNSAYEMFLTERQPGEWYERALSGSNYFYSVVGCELTKNYSLIRRSAFYSRCWVGDERGSTYEEVRTPLAWDDDVKIGGGEHASFFIDLKKLGFNVAYVSGVNINAQEGSDSPRYNKYRRRACRPERECFKRRGIKKYVLADGTIDFQREGQ